TGAAAVSLTGLPGVSAAATPRHTGKTPVVPTITPGTHTSFPALKQVKAGLLNVGYAELGPARGPVVICLHGWPYDIHSYVDVAPLLAEQGYRVIVPYLR
ncbi:alpha/beta hydrolase, partial [Streptomyces sp. SID11233]|nr:alpha/beta hydrolase [Streptomyces sp. SID11233]